ncbi:TonB-dependent receptor [Massilia sp. TW-1]|uniref:TonB-dependent receptor n=1 Tax=Telluria antibiotica TaxID=2717319 RepID=A0ABX0PK99_9BURK|nr:TonB-dependent receptor [Telluria antibiotica]NIA57236.1 TonB-dependent receptor [Telluria antibiotica]
MLKETVISRSVRVMFAGGLVAGSTLLAQAALAQDAQQPIARVEVTGSSIKRADVEGSLPVQMVTRDDIKRSGATNTAELLTTLTANSMVGATNQAEGAGLSTYGESTASLRGLGASKTLVLVNGRRLGNYATDGTAVDVNSIPLASIDHVEVLKDGASGVYGSDAIGGVINFITRNNYQGVELNGYASVSRYGGGQTKKASILAGWGDFDADRYNFTVSADVSKDDAIFGRQRSYAQNAWRDDGFRDSSATPSGNLTTFLPTTTPNASGVVPNTLTSTGSGLGNPLSPNNCANNGSGYDANFGTCRFNSSPYVNLVPQVKRANVGGSFRFKLNDNAEFFTEGFVSRNVTLQQAQPSPYSNAFLSTDPAFAQQNVYPSIVIAPNSPYYPSAWLAANAPDVAGQPVSVSYRAFDGGERKAEDTATSSHLVLGFRGNVKGYDYDVAYTHNSSDVTERTLSGYQNQVALINLLSNNNTFNPFTQYQDPALAAKIRATNYVGPIINAVLRNDALNARVSGELFQLPAGAVSFAVGASLADENLSVNPSTAYQSGDVSGYGSAVLPLSASRNSSAVFAETIIPIIKHLEADVAVRTDRYPNATATNPKVSFRYQPFSQLLLRASYGKGFREPSLPELYTQQTLGTSGTFTDPVTKQAGQFNVMYGGNPNLKPEKSEQAAFGVVVDPVKGLSIAVDYWKINVNNLVTSLAPAFVVGQAAAGNPQYTGLVARDSLNNITSIVGTNINAGGVKTAGIDVDARWAILKSPTYGNFNLRLNGTYTTKYDLTLPDGTVQQSVARTVDAGGNLLNAVSNSGAGVVMRWRDQLTLDWKFQKWGASLTNNFQSGYYDNVRFDTPSEGPFTAQRVGAFSTWDAQASYAGFRNLTLTAGVKNLFNRKPTDVITGGSYFQTGYDPSWYDPHGQTAYVSANYKF